MIATGFSFSTIILALSEDIFQIIMFQVIGGSLIGNAQVIRPSSITWRWWKEAMRMGSEMGRVGGLLKK
jgi:hypothetical protein